MSRAELRSLPYFFLHRFPLADGSCRGYDETAMMETALERIRGQTDKSIGRQVMPRHSHSANGYFCLVWIVASFAAGAGGAGGVQVPDPSLMLPLVPAAAQAPAPPVIKPGTRLTYFGMTASIPGEYGRLVQDETGEWIDKNTGKRYREEEVGASGSAAFNVVSVGHVGDGVAELSTKIYGLDTATKKCTFGAGGGMVGHAGCTADYWIHPAVLKEVREVNAQGMRILRMPYTAGGKTYKAIRFQKDDLSGFQARVYDLETGLMVYHGTRVQGPSVITPPIGRAGMAGMGEGSSQVITGWLVEVKDIDVPWKNAAAPQWIEQFQQLSYKGVQTSAVAVAGTKLDRAMTGTLTPKARGPGWVRFTNRFLFESIPGMPPDEVLQDGACGEATIGGFWIAPEALAGLRPQQVIETNPHVGITVSVTDVRPGSVTISEVGPLHRSDCTYDTRTGMLSATTLVQQIGLAQITHRLQLTGQQ